MTTLIRLGLVAFALLLGSQDCSAARARVFFGKQEHLHSLTDVALKGSQGEDLLLAFKTSQRLFGLGLYCKRDGYVLVPRSDTTLYFKPTDAEIERYQRDGLLPNPLPAFKMPLEEYVIGFSLWWVALLAAAYLKVKEHLRRRSKIVTPQQVPDR